MMQTAWNITLSNGQKGQKTLSQNIEATTKANHRQTESDNQVIRKKEELIAKMKLLNTQAEKAGISLNF